MNSLPRFFHSVFTHPVWKNPKTLTWIWVLIPIIASLTKLHKYNNYLIYKYTFVHAWNGESLYAPDPDHYFDVNHYGPLFSLLIAPFAIMPIEWIGLLFWHVLLTLFLYYAIKKSTFSWPVQMFILWFCVHELLTAIFMSQFNVAIAAIILMSFWLVEKEKDVWATLLIAIGILVKIYGVVGLAFFFFSKHKKKYFCSLIFWICILFFAPMLIASPDYVFGQYNEWVTSLIDKNEANLLSSHQNISLLGIVRKVGYACSAGYASLMQVMREETLPDASNWWLSVYSDKWLLLTCVLLFCLPYLRFAQWKNVAFRQAFLASVMMVVLLFSTGSESSGYIIAMIGCVVWYATVPWQRSSWDVVLMVFLFVLTSLSPSDLFPSFLRKSLVQPFALKALPVVLIWGKLVYEMLTKDYSPLSINRNEEKN